MKRFLCFLTVMVLAVSVLSASITASAETSGMTGDCTWSLNGTVLAISGEGAMGDYSGEETKPWGNTITQVVIEDGVTGIGHGAFSGCSFLFSVTIPDSVVRVGAYAFEDTAYYNNEQNWTEGVLYIDNHLIDANTDLAGSYEIREGTRSIGVYAFESCTELTSVVIPESVSVVGDSAFFNCTGLTSVTFPENLAEIDEGAFANCIALASVTIPESVTAIGDFAFYCCEKLAAVELPYTVETIGAQAFDTKLAGDDATLYVHDDSFGYAYAVKSGNPYELTEHSYKGGLCTICEKLKYSIDEAILLLKHIDGHDVGLTDEEADVNGDGKVTIFDAVRYLQYINLMPLIDQQNLITVVDYNIRVADDGDGNDRVDRAPRLLAFLEKYDPDIIGLQEAGSAWINYLENGCGQHAGLLEEYEMRYTRRAQSDSESTPLLWKKDKFELLDEGYYWLSETPDQESIGWEGGHYRICNWVKLKVKATGLIFIFVNTHLDGGDRSLNSAYLIAERTRAEGGMTECPVILTGDFNCPPESDAYNAFISEGFVDINDALGFDPSYTNNGYNTRPDDDSGNSIKDYIMIAGEGIVPLEYEVKNESYYDGWISDHRGLYGEIALLG